MSATELPNQQREDTSFCWRSSRVLGNCSLAQIFADLVEDDCIRLGEECYGSAILRSLVQLRQLRRRAHGRALTWQDALLVDGLLEAYSSVDDDLDAVLRETLDRLSQSDPAINDLIIAWQNVQRGIVGGPALTLCRSAENGCRSSQ